MASTLKLKVCGLNPLTDELSKEYREVDDFILEYKPFKEVRVLPEELRVDAKKVLDETGNFVGKSYTLNEFTGKVKKYGCVVLSYALSDEETIFYLGVAYDEEGTRTTDLHNVETVCLLGKIIDVTGDKICKACC